VLAQLPSPLDPTIKEAFRYDAGPVPSPLKLQVFKAGDPRGLGYGLRVLQDVAEGSFIGTYWGEYDVRTVPDSKDYLTALPWLAYQHGGVTTDDQDAEWRKYDVTLRACYDRGFGDMALMQIDSSTAGNFARWMNHSVGNANVEARLVSCTGMIIEHVRGVEAQHSAQQSALAQMVVRHTDGSLRPGMHVILVGLVSRADLNGTVGKVLTWGGSSGRWSVHVDVLVKTMNFRAANLGAVDVAMRPLVAFYAKRAISCGEELMWDYIQSAADPRNFALGVWRWNTAPYSQPAYEYVRDAQGRRSVAVWRSNKMLGPVERREADTVETLFIGSDDPERFCGEFKEDMMATGEWLAKAGEVNNYFYSRVHGSGLHPNAVMDDLEKLLRMRIWDQAYPVLS
jgi:hypothetical protein